MKYWSIILVFVSINFCFGQGPRFRLYITKSCSTIEQLDTSYELVEIGKLDTGYSPISGTVHLPAKGRYMIWCQGGGPILDTVFDIEDASLYVFRYKEPEVQLYESGATDTPPLYYMCDRPINGYAEAFYPNGTLKVRGDFKDGFTKDSLVTFYSNGKAMKRVNILPKSHTSHRIVTIKDYSVTGQLIKITHNEYKSSASNYDSIDTAYYPSGKIQIIESRVDGVYTVKKFYLNGRLKVKQTERNRVEYYANGAKYITYNWVYKTETQATDNGFTVNKKEYNKSGQLIQSAFFEYRSHGYPSPEINIAESDWIDSITTYKAGKKTVIVKDVDPKEYLKDHPADQSTE